MKTHRYEVSVAWADATGTLDYRSYTRSHIISAMGKPPLEASSDPAFRGDAGRYNPEELLVAAISSCHMLWYLHLCAESGIVVTAYRDVPIGEMEMNADGSGQFTHVTLRPDIELSSESDRARAETLHEKAHAMCFIARSVKFPVIVRAG